MGPPPGVTSPMLNIPPGESLEFAAESPGKPDDDAFELEGGEGRGGSRRGPMGGGGGRGRWRLLLVSVFVFVFVFAWG